MTGPENLEIPQTFQTSSVTAPNSDEIAGVTVHTIQINPAGGAVFPHSGLGVEKSQR